MRKQTTVSICEGPILKNLLRYALPLIATGMLQLFYNSADLIVVARWAGGTALAAVGATTSLIHLIINLFVGISVGASVAVAQYFGARDPKNVRESVHSAMGLSVICGLLTMLICLLFSGTFLRMMHTPLDVLGQAALYMRIYALGLPASMVYNFAAAILRAVGDSKRPFYILCFAGVINILLNMVLVIGFHWDVAGVAAATSVSQLISAILAVVCLCRADDCYRFEIKKMRLYREKVILMLHNGIPAGLQNAIFSFSNVLVQSAINSFGSAAMCGSSAATSLENYVYEAMFAINNTCMAFVGQNVGAGNRERINRICRECLLLVTGIGIGLGGAVYLFGDRLLLLYTAASGTQTTVPAELIIRYGLQKLRYICLPYFLYGIMDVFVGAMRGMGRPWGTMAASIVGICGIRITWIYTAFRFRYHTLGGLYFCYPLSWMVTLLVQFFLFLRVRRQCMEQLAVAKNENFCGKA